jgi:hypothetical protein
MRTARSSGSRDFLLGAVMRFGKNFTYLADCLDYVPYNGNILVLTNRPKVFSSLKKDGVDELISVLNQWLEWS